MAKLVNAPLRDPNACRTMQGLRQSGLRGDLMFKRISVILLAAAGALALSGCITPYEGRPSTCEGNGPGDPNWPYCSGSPPGGNFAEQD